MELREIVEKIELPTSVIEVVLSFEKEFHWKEIQSFFKTIHNPDTWKQSVNEIEIELGDDPNGLKMLTFMLLCAAESIEEYRKKGISDEIFIDTMRFCTRFTKEHHQIYGHYAFTWGWWLPRQISLHEFRIGTLEYEMIMKDGEKKINIHIPSDADIDKENLGKSYQSARAFFSKYFPEYSDASMVCESWMLAPKLQEILPEASNIIGFQKAFEIVRIDEESNGCLRWVYGRDDIPFSELSEKTSLQRNIKKLLLQGERIGEAFGILKENPWNK